jgi:ADP-ribose pyrophosphatase YjhB (NUDIX family)
MPMLPKAEYLATLPRKRMIASAIIRDSAGNVLRVIPTYKETWLLPGVSVEAGESPSDACARESQEKLDTAATVGRLMAVGHLPPVSDDPHGAMAFVYDAMFDGVPVATLTLPAYGLP